METTFPSIFRGRLAYGHVAGEVASTVRLGSLTGGRTRTVWSNRSESDYGVRQTAVGTGGAVAIVTVRDGAGNGAYRALLARPGRTAKRLQSVALGDTHTGGLSVAVNRSGRRLMVTRRFDGSTTTTSYALPSGRAR